MIKFVKRLLIFISPLMVLLFLAEVIISFSPSILKTKRDFVEKNINSVEVLALGSSHMQHAINPECLSLLTSNLASGAQDMKLNYKLFEKYFNELTSLKYVIIELDYFTLDNKLHPDHWRNNLYLRYFNINNFRETHRLSITDYILFMSNIKLYSQYILTLFDPEHYKYKKNKYGYVIDNFEGRFKDLKYDKDKIERTKPLKHSTIKDNEFKTNSRYLERIIRTSVKNNKTVILLSIPVYETYRSQMIDKKNLKRLNLVKRLTKKYPNTYFLNYEDDNSFDVRDFINDDHLNIIGARKFCAILDKQITNIANETIKR